jgi:hypothetical protein
VEVQCMLTAWRRMIIVMQISHWLKASRLLYILIGQLLRWR